MGPRGRLPRESHIRSLCPTELGCFSVSSDDELTIARRGSILDGFRMYKINKSDINKGCLLLCLKGDEVVKLAGAKNGMITKDDATEVLAAIQGKL